MRKTKLTALSSLVAVSLLSAFGTQAATMADNATLNLKGKLMPGACNVTLSGDVDYGTMSVKDIRSFPDPQTRGGAAQHAAAMDDGTGYAADPKSVDLTINCSAATKAFFTAMTTSPDSNFGRYTNTLIDSSGDELGVYAVIVHPEAASVDGNKTGSLAYSDNLPGSTVVSIKSQTTHRLGTSDAWGVAGSDSNGAVNFASFKELVVPMDIPVIFTEDALAKITTITPFSADVTFIVNYL